MTNLAAGATMAYTDVPDGSYEIVIVPTGTTDLAAAYIDSSETFASGAVRTMLIANAAATSSSRMTAVIGADLD